MRRRRYHVIATARDIDALADLDVSERLQLDVTSPRSITEALDRAGHIDILVNNAGLGIRGPVEQMPIESVRELFETTFFGPLALIQGVLPGMRNHGDGLIVNVSSGMAGLVVRPLFAFYPAAKVALEAISEGLWHEVGRFGIRVLVIQPGNIATNFRPAMRRLGNEGPYAELADGIDRWRMRAQQSELKMDVDEFARQAVDAIESPDRRLRVPIGQDAIASLANRRAQTDEEFRESVLKEFIPEDDRSAS
jgi:short-subunit dehydrogenase